MSTTPISIVENMGPAWARRPVTFFTGTYDTHIATGEDYETRTLGELFHLEPADAPKMEGPAFIPSSYHDYDAREHGVQRMRGEYVALTCDIDKGDHGLQRVESLVRAFCGDAAWLIYSSPHAQPGDKRWRAIIPLDEPATFEDWFDAQSALFAFMDMAGVAVDHALSRAAQPVFLPNIPAKHAKTGAALRDGQGRPLHYQRQTTGTNAQGLSLDNGPVSAGILSIRRKRAEDDAERERLKREAEKRRANRDVSQSGDIIVEFNRSTSIATLLESYGYRQSPRHPEDWRSPNQQGETYATRIMGDKWVSLSSSDAGARIGAVCSTGCYGDAYDLFVHYEHQGDHKAAFRQLHRERKAAAMTSPVEWAPDSAAVEYDPETGDPIFDMPVFDDAGDVAAPESDRGDMLPLFSPAEWTGKTPPERQWRWENFIPDYQATLLTGAGAAGKSLATQQMCTCVAMGLPFLGIATKRTPSLYITCEDDLEELHRRQESICAALGISLEDTRGKLFLLSLQGEIGNELAMFDGAGGMEIAPRYMQIEQTCIAKGIGHVTIDNTAHTFAGNENDRHEVAAFVNLNNRLAQAIRGSVVMVGHPNKSGDSYSGSTAWENQVRSRLYLEVPKGEEGIPLNPDMRVLRNEKANYSQRGAEVRFWWVKGAFIADGELSEQPDHDVRDVAQAGFENDVFLALLAKLTEQRRHVSHARNLSNYAPKVMAEMPDARGLSKGQFAKAMERLFTLDIIAASQPLWNGRDRHPVLGLARKDAAAGGAK